MPSESDLEARAAALRRTVYGTPGGDRSGAADELLAVEGELRRVRAGSGAPPVASHTRPVASDRHPVIADAAATHPPRRRRTALIAAAAVAAVALATVAVVQVRDLVEPPRGLEVFDRPQQPEDTGLRGYEVALGPRADTLRHVGRAAGHDAWVFRDADTICLVVQRGEWEGWGASCVDAAEFSERGIRQPITYDEVSGGARPADLRPGDALELRFLPGSTALEWAVVEDATSGGRERVWVPSFDLGDAPMTYEEWSSR